MDGTENEQMQDSGNNADSKKAQEQESQSVPNNSNPISPNPATAPATAPATQPIQQPETGTQNSSQVNNPQAGTPNQIPETQPAPPSSIPQPEQNKVSAQQEETQKKEDIEKLKLKNANVKKIALSVILILFIAAVAYIFISGLVPISHKTTVTTTISSTTTSNIVSTSTSSTTTTVKPVVFKSLSRCTDINESGKYIVNSIIATNISNGSCISINASNVYISCNGKNITGAGPFVNSPPFTYGISADNKTNITLSKCNVKDFSYGVYLDNVSNASISGSNLSINFVSELALINSHSINASNNHFSKSETYKGAVYISNNSSQITFKNNSVLYNAFYGINVSSQGNRFISNYINGTPVSFYCSLNSSFTKSSYAKSNICYNNTQCSFVACTGFNKPANLSYINLSNSRNTQKTINECGSINNPGVYSLSSNINMGDFVNVSNPLVGLTPLLNSMHMRCININSSNVSLDCRNHIISNSPIAIYASNMMNISLNNCNIKNSSIGIKFEKVISGNLTNINVSGSNISVMLKNTSGIFAHNLTALRSSIGLYMLNSSADSFNKLLILNNSLFGLFVNKSLGNIFTNGTIINNSVVDVYATSNANVTNANLMQKVTCGVTDANWAACKLHLSVSLAYIPVKSCEVISRSGNYSIINNLISNSQTCINIKANNVRLNCLNHSITGTGMLDGVAVYNRTNVTVDSCDLYGFDSGITVNNSQDISLLNNTIKSSILGIVINTASNANIKNNSIKYSASNSSIYLDNVTHSVISDNNASFGLSQSTGIAIINSVDNLINNNTGVNNYFGMRIENMSGNNTVMNNTMLSNKQADYYCSSANSNMSSENGGINYGNTKIGCYWMASVSKLSPYLSCNLVPSGSLYSLGRDFIYPYNSTCYQIIKSNDSTLNCNGHTLIATKGGVLIDAVNATGITLENCYLKGFSSPVIAKNTSINILNNTFYSTQQEETAINSSYSNNVKIKRNDILGFLVGINMFKDLNSMVFTNKVNSANAYLINKSVNIQISNNTATTASTSGLSLISSTPITLFNNTLLGKSGLSCTFSSQNTTSNLDLGNNTCSSNSGCGWITKSASICH